MNAPLPREVDVLVVGAGPGGLACASFARAQGRDVLVLEASPYVGGTTALSAGGIWLPHNPVMQEDGIPDSVDDAVTYLQAIAGDQGPAATPARQRAFVTGGIRALNFLRGKGVHYVRSPYPDYYAEAPGGHGWPGRMLGTPAYDGRRLGAHRDWVQPRPPMPLGLVIDTFSDMLPLLGTSLKARLGGVRLLLRSLGKRLRGMDPLVLGAAHIAQLLEVALRAGVPFSRSTPMERLLVDGARRVTGVVARVNGGAPTEIRARQGVLLNAGGICHDQPLRDKYGPQPATTAWTQTVPTHDGIAVRAGMDVGAAVTGLDSFYWSPVTLLPGGPCTTAGLLAGGMAIEADRHFPYSIIVDSTGARFTNEAAPYMEFGNKIYAHGTKAVPCWFILESRHRARYGFGVAPPGLTPRAWLRPDFLRKAGSLRELAASCHIDPDRLEATVQRFNRMAREGIDRDFHRGETLYDRIFSDPAAGPNPCLGPLEQAPFYAAPVYPSDVGCAGGLVTDEFARVLRDGTGEPIPGLYACGTTAASAMGTVYPGGGASVGQSLVFGFIAGEHLCGVMNGGSSP